MGDVPEQAILFFRSGFTPSHHNDRKKPPEIFIPVDEGAAHMQFLNKALDTFWLLEAITVFAGHGGSRWFLRESSNAEYLVRLGAAYVSLFDCPSHQIGPPSALWIICINA